MVYELDEMTPAIEVIDLIKGFKLGRVVISALRGVSFTVEKGGFVCIMGPSGSGKSTLLNLIGGLDRFTFGKILVDGVDIGKLKETELAQYRRKRIGFVFQSYYLLTTLTALKNVELPLLFTGVSRRQRESQAREVLEAVGLGERTEHHPTELSGGEQQRVALARALVNQPSIVLADEPTGNLDSQTSKEIMELLRAMNQASQQTFIVVTHDAEVSQHADRVLHIRDGRIVNKVG
jgi:putative ABC transport system ATP-binding protein